MSDNQQASGRPSATRFHRQGSGDGLVVLDSGQARPDEIWNAVASDINRIARLILVDRTGDGPDVQFHPDDDARLLRREIESIHEHQQPVSRLILVGWSEGSFTIATAARLITDPVPAVVLIDPEPYRCAPSATGCSDHFSNLGDLDFRNVPITIVLPGKLPDFSDAAAQVRQEQQDRFLTLFPYRREVIAGRSSACIPSERPDVVIDAILHHLNLTR